MMLKKIFKLKLLILLLSVFCNLHSFSFFADYKANKNYQKKDYQSAREILQKEQTDDPNNALINYNLGTIDYKLNKQQSAKNNFQRAAKLAKNNNLKEKAYFNWGNSLCKNSQNILGKDWENKKVDDKKLERATKEFKSAIEKYKNTLTLNKENKQAESNLKSAEELVQKLIVKQQEQKQQQEQNQEQNQDQDQDQDKNQDQQSKQDNSSEKQQGSEDKGDQKVQEEQQEGSKENASDEQEENKNNGEKDKLDKEHGQEEQEKIDNHDDNSSEKEEQTQPGEEGTQQKEENQALREEEANAAMQEAQVSEEQETTDLKKREMISLLEKLQDDESKMQKQMIWQKSKSLQRPQNNAQKPW